MKLPFITWRDHYSSIDNNWECIGEIEDPEPLVCRSVGWVVRENKTMVTLISNLDGCPHDLSDRNGYGVMNILKAAIVRRVTLNPNKK